MSSTFKSHAEIDDYSTRFYAWMSLDLFLAIVSIVVFSGLAYFNFIPPTQPGHEPDMLIMTAFMWVIGSNATGMLAWLMLYGENPKRLFQISVLLKHIPFTSMLIIYFLRA